MWYWNSENFEGLKEISVEINNRPDLDNFRKYLDYREQGIRKQAFSALNTFLKEIGEWAEQERRKFVYWILEVSAKNPEIHHLIPEPLNKGVVKPVLKDWIAEDDDVRAIKWSGILELNINLMEKAISLDPSDRYTISRAYNYHINDLDFYLHHFPHELLAPLEKVCAEIEVVDQWLGRLPNIHAQSLLREDLQEYRQKVDDWGCFLNSEEDDFKIWAQKNDRDYGWPTIVYYDADD